MDDVFGQDIKLGDDGTPIIAGNGELVLAEGTETGVQDIRLRLEQPLGELFYDVDFGSLIHRWVKEESTPENHAAFAAEVETRVEEDPRVTVGSVACSVATWDPTGITATVRWAFIDEDQPFNLVVSWDNAKNELVVKDDNPRASL